MAQTVEQIYNAIIAEKQSLASLNTLMPTYNLAPPTPANPFVALLNQISTASQVGRWRLTAYIMAYFMYLQQVLFDAFVALVTSIVANYIPGTDRWYYTQAMNWQFGVELVWTGPTNQLPGSFGYATPNPSLQLVQYCAVVEPGDFVLIKVAKQVGGLPAPLATDELNSLIGYFSEIQYAGVQVQVVSFSADYVRIYANIFYDPIQDLPALQANVYAAVNAFIIGLPFNGRFNLTKLSDALQAVAGVIDPRISEVDYKYGALAYTEVVGEYQTNAGYVQIDPAYPLTATLTFTPYV